MNYDHWLWGQAEDEVVAYDYDGAEIYKGMYVYNVDGEYVPENEVKDYMNKTFPHVTAYEMMEVYNGDWVGGCEGWEIEEGVLVPEGEEETYICEFYGASEPIEAFL